MIPRGVWVLGFVSMLMDISSEMIHSLLPVFMVSGLGASMFLVGVVEGIAEATALIVKVFSGTISDYLGRRKGLTVLGYGLGAISKPIFALAVSVHWVLVARFMDRIGKGIRGAPRDALVADLTSPEIRGAAYGLRQSLDTVGAFLGPVLAIGLMLLFAGNFRAVFWFAVIPAVLSVLLLVRGLHEPATVRPRGEFRAPVAWGVLREMGRDYWWVVSIGAIFTLARFSEAFLILRAQQFGLTDAYAPLVLVVMNVAYAGSAYPMGRLADRLSHRTLIGAGLATLVISDLVLAQAQNLTGIAAGVMLWGLHMGMTQGLLATMVAAATPAQLRGTAFGFFNLASGLAMLFASVLAGFLWESLGAATTYYAGACFAAIALILLLSHRRLS